MVGTGQAFWIFVVIVLLFGAKRIPDLAGALGKGIREFKKAADGDGEEDKKKLDNKDEKKS